MDVTIVDTKAELGRRAAHDGAETIRQAIRRDGEANVILATGASQFELLATLAGEDVDWGRVTAFHLDEYAGMPQSHPASFRRYLRERFLDFLPRPLLAFHPINGEGDCAAECRRLGALIAPLPIALAFVGIGENGHLAFNDPPADFETETPYLVVDLDEACRRQQLGEGWFPTLEDVPTQAISMSIRQILKSGHIVCSAPDSRKARPVQATLEGPVTPLVPASVLQQHPSTNLYLDPVSAALLRSGEPLMDSLQVCGKTCETGEVVTLSVADGRIQSMRCGSEGATLGGPEWWLSPGFLDLQLNGYGGCDFNVGFWGGAGDGDDLYVAFDLAARAGTPLLCPTIVTNGAEAMTAGLSRLARFLDGDAGMARRVPGIHLEGPYFCAEDGPRGAHPLEHVRDPYWDEFQRFQEAAGDRIKICTLAPERPGALGFIEKLVASGVVAALGHTGASPEIIRDAVRAGARLSTHLGNGSHDRIKRHPNYIWEQLANDDLFATIITDGEHLPDSVVKCFARAKGAERLALVSDAVSLGGLPAGVYNGGQHEVLPSGRVVLVGTPYLAGAGALLDTCAANALRMTDLSLAQVTRCASTIPARILGLEGRKGYLQAGYDADLTLFRVPEVGPLEIGATVCAGEVVYRK